MSEETVGSIEVTICIRFNKKITPEQARYFVDEMNYEIKDTTGKVSISDTEVIDDNVPVMPSDTGDGYITLMECIESGDHLKNCDGDGYCNLCGEQTSEEDIEDQDHSRGLYGPEYPGEQF